MTFVAPDGATLDLFDHPYNVTARNERAIEVPIARRFIAERSPGLGLEVGNVLAHYTDGPPPWPVVDKHEQGPGVVNVDVLAFRPPPDRFPPRNWIVSVSTIEHVGWDEGGDPLKGLDAIQHLRSLLAPGGALLVTVPTGYNPHLDAHLPTLDCETTFYERVESGRWEIAPFRALPYDRETPSATGLWVGEFGP